MTFHAIFWDRKVKVYLLVNLCLFILNMTESRVLWFLYPLCIWGAILFFKKAVQFKALV